MFGMESLEDDQASMEYVKEKIIGRQRWICNFLDEIVKICP